MWGTATIESAAEPAYELYLAPFNVDDNAGVDSIYWFATANSNTSQFLNIKYTCQEWPYTDGGKSINGIVVETDSFTYNYTVTESQDGALKNGAEFLSDSFSYGGVSISISSRTIDDPDCLPPGVTNLTLFEIAVNMESGLYYQTQIGGALWRIWKKLAAEGPTNNTSEAGFDGIADYTGIPRSSFGSSALMEPLDPNTLLLLANQFNVIDNSVGYVNFDWDPIATPGNTCSSSSYSSSSSSGSSSGSAQFGYEYQQVTQGVTSYIVYEYREVQQPNPS